MVMPITRILVRAPNWVGDQVLAYPFFYYLRKAFPDAWIASACVNWVSDLQFMSLVNEVIPLPNGFFKKVREARTRGAWDLGIALPNSFSAALFLKMSRCRVVRGYRHDARGFLLDEAIAWKRDPSRHRSQAYLDLVSEVLPDGLSAPSFWALPGSHFDATREWPRAQALEPPSEKYWVLAPGSKAESRRWPVERYLALARKIAAETSLIGVIVGGADEAPLAEVLLKDRDIKLISLVAQGKVSSLWKVFAGARFTVCNESGLAHVASLCGSPVEIICGAADPRRTQPIGPGPVKVMVNAVDCWPCERNVCHERGERYLQCLRGIEPNAVWGEIKNRAH